MKAKEWFLEFDGIGEPTAVELLQRILPLEDELFGWYHVRCYVYSIPMVISFIEWNGDSFMAKLDSACPSCHVSISKFLRNPNLILRCDSCDSDYSSDRVFSIPLYTWDSGEVKISDLLRHRFEGIAEYVVRQEAAEYSEVDVVLETVKLMGAAKEIQQLVSSDPVLDYILRYRPPTAELEVL